jgi:glucose-1-phosphate adenylyltransferase
MRQSSVPDQSNILAIILAGGQGTRLHDLTQSQAKPALPVGPAGRLIDFTLANVAHSRIERAMILTQYAPERLHGHLENLWRPMKTTQGLSLDILDGAAFGGFGGTADAVAKVREEIDRAAPDHVVILAGDHLYQMDYRPFVARHVQSGAQAMVGAIHVPIEEAHEFGVMELGPEGKILAFQEKPADPAQSPDRPGYALASMGIYVFDWALLRGLLDEMARANGTLDFGKHVLPQLVEAGGAYAYALPGRGQAAPLWRDLGTLDAYHAVHAELANGAIALDPSWPILVARHSGPPLRPAGPPSGQARSTGCSIGEGALIGARCALRNVVVLPGARIGDDVTLTDAIVTDDAVVPPGFDLDRAMRAPVRWCTISEGGIRIVSAKALATLARLDPALLSGASRADEPVRPRLAATGR